MDPLRRVALAQRAVAAGMTAGVLISWKLWVTTRLFPHFPLLGPVPQPPSPADFLLLALFLGAALGLAARPLNGALLRIFLAAGAVLLFLDQMRWQPWVWFYLLMALPPACGPGASPRLLLHLQRLVVAGLLFWGGAHKLGFLGSGFAALYEGYLAAPLLGAAGGAARDAVLLFGSLIPWLELGIAAYAFAIVLGIPLGILGGVKPRSVWDWLLSGYTMVAVGIPSFVTGIILLWIFAAELRWFPSLGRVSFLSDPVDSLHHLALPVVALALPISAVLARYTRTTITDVVGQDFVRTARAKGLGESTVIVRHALRNSLIPVITIMALQVGEVLTGVVIIEAVFTRPGLGRVVVEAIQRLDYLVVQTVLVVLVVIFVTVNLLADIIYGFADPRVRVR